MSKMHTREALLAGTPLSRRGLVAARADAGAPGAAEIKALVEGVNRAFEEFKATNDKRLAEIEKKGAADPVTAEKLEKLNAAILEQQKALDEANTRMASLQLGGGGGDGLNPEARQQREEFRAFLRRGTINARTTTYSDPDGGFLAPPTLDTAVTRILSQTLALRRMAQVQPISSGSWVQFKSLGAAGAGWVGESESNNTARPETATPQLVRIEFTPGELYAEPYATQTALDDMVVDVEAWLAGEVAITFGEREGAAFVSGDGIKKPRGFLSYTTVANASYAWGSIGFLVTGAAAAFASSNPADCFVDAIYALKPGYRQNAGWLMNDLVASSVRKFKDGQGNYLWQPSVVAGQPSLFMGYPVETDDNMPNLAANAFPVAFADWRQAYKIVDRVGTRVLRNPYKVNGQVAFYTTRRVGGGVQNFEAIKLIRCST
jgi:HK97 family phage major capsid protein